MRKFTFKSLLIAAALCLGTSAWAEDDYQIVGGVDFETEATFRDGWVLSSSSKVQQNYGTRSISTGTSHFYCQRDNSGGNRIGTYTIPNDMFTSSKNWKLEFDAAIYNGNSVACELGVTAGESKLFNIVTGTWGAPGTVSDSNDKSIGSITVDAHDKNTRGNLVAVSTWFHFILKGNESDGVTLQINSSAGDAIISKTKVADFANATAIRLLTGSAFGQVAIDDIIYSIVSDKEIVESPTAHISRISGKNREITMICNTNNAEIYYSANESAEVKYTGPFEISETTEFSITAKTPTGGVSEKVLCTFEAGTEILLNKPSITRTGAYSFTIKSNETNVDGYVVPLTLNYKIGNGQTQVTTNTSMNLSDVDGDIVAWVSSDGAIDSETAEFDYVAPVIAKEIWAYNLNSYPASKSVTSITDAINTEAKITVGGVEAYNLKDIEYANLFVENTSNWLLRNQAASAWKAQYGRANIIINNVSESDVIYVYSRRDNGGAGVYSVTNGSIKYDYNSIEYFIVPNGTDPVVININNGCAVNNISVSTTKVPTAISAAGYATFSSTYAVDFSKAAGLAAYTAKVNGGNQTITLTKIADGIVPANTGVVLKGAAGEYTGTITTTEAVIENNDLVAATKEIASLATETTVDEVKYKNYILNVVDQTPGFYQAAGKKVAAGKAYLQVPAETVTGAKTLTIVWNDGETTGIEENYEFGTMNSDAATFDLSGRKVANPAKGLYIKNGKKFIVK